MEAKLLEKIVKNTEHKTSFQIIVSGNESSFNTMFSPSLKLAREKVYEIALVNLETYYSFPNMDESNNIFVYSPDNGNSWVKIKIPEGSYEIDDINNTCYVHTQLFLALYVSVFIFGFPCGYFYNRILFCGVLFWKFPVLFTV